MADLALSDYLMDEYLKYKFQENFDTNKIRKLFKYILPFVMRESYPLLSDPSIPMQLENDPLIEIIDNCSDEELIQSTRLKLMLIDKPITSAPTFTTVNISGLSEKLQPKYGASYPNSTDKNKAQAHIKALLSDAHWIKITDGYIANNDWNSNKALINTLIPHKKLDLTIVTNNFTQKSDLEAICNTWNVRTPQFPSNIHDRYIETDKVKILLSSGLFHLSSSSNKDFTYIVEIKTMNIHS